MHDNVFWSPLVLFGIRKRQQGKGVSTDPDDAIDDHPDKRRHHECLVMIVIHFPLAIVVVERLQALDTFGHQAVNVGGAIATDPFHQLMLISVD